MAFEVRIPTLGESVTEGVIVRWAKQEGERVERDEILLELETDKASMEIAAEQAGVLRIVKDAGATVTVGEVVARLEAGAGAAAPAAAMPPPAAPNPPASAAPTTAPTPAASAAAQATPAPAAAVTGRPVGPLSPAVRTLITEHALDPATIPPSGKGGRLTKGDVLAHIAQPPAAAPATPPPPPPVAASASAAQAPAAAPPRLAPIGGTTGKAGEEAVPLSRLRKRIAERLVQAQHTAAILTTFNEVDMTAVMALRSAHKERFQKAHGVGLGFMSFFARACISSLSEVPAVNAEIRGDDVVYKHFVNLGVAVGTERGLVVPVVKNADGMTFAEIEREILRLAGLARDGKLSIDDLSGGTFTISNGGVYGSLLSTPILNPPQSGILGMHKIEKRPIVIDDQIVIRPMMYLALSYDHRLVDGEQAVTFLVRVKERLEEPARLLLEV
ncbi:MAG: 2-oxoglutarate dehydrogenase complex dihydrolipoyllysine-residue succinyltransferase [Candidatus Binatia bacterium]